MSFWAVDKNHKTYEEAKAYAEARSKVTGKRYAVLDNKEYKSGDTGFTGHYMNGYD